MSDDPLELILALAGDADGIPLDHGFHLRKSVANALRELLGLLRCEAALQQDLLSNGAARCGLELAPVEDLERQAAPNGLGFDQVPHRLGPELVVCGEGDLALAQLQGASTALEVEPGRDLAPNLVEGVYQLLLVEVAHNVEARFCR